MIRPKVVLKPNTKKTKRAEQMVEGDTGSLYILKEFQFGDGHDQGTQCYKVGKTKQDIAKRLSDLQTGNPRLLKFKSVEVTNMSNNELRAHAAAEDVARRIWIKGRKSEWFYLPQGTQEERFIATVENGIEKWGNNKVKNFVPKGSGAWAQ